MASNLLNEAYNALGYNDGVLLDAVHKPKADSKEAEHWLDKGDWLSLANKVGAEKVFFVNNDPVIVFSKFSNEPEDKELLQTFQRAWCMARPQKLFISRPGILEVYDLNQAPPREVTDWHPLDVAKSINEVAEKLHTYHREQIESGHIFAERHFGNIDERADYRLINDLKAVRKALLDAGLREKKRFAHALIGRLIFIRYLEDRGILTPEYFEQLASGNAKWQEILAKKSEKPCLTSNHRERRLDRILRDKAFTYALFDKLANDFNGDMFPRDKDEEESVNQDHLNLLRRFLLGESSEQGFFFWAYDFEIIPIELISSIYEEFYHDNNEDDKGTHYTPCVLVDFVLSQVLTSECLAANPRILDPACGSGIFLVESFRRIVRYHVQKNGKIPSPRQLREFLGTQINGIEINKEAIQVTAFSLYLALLHYQEPPDILTQIRESKSNDKPLPNLIYDGKTARDSKHYNILFNADTFGLMGTERSQLEAKLNGSKRFNGRAEIKRVYDSKITLPLEAKSFDVIVGNPPWGFKKSANSEIQKAQGHAHSWCEAFGWSIGDKELSQAFIARSMTMIKDDGVCGLLVPIGVFLKHSEPSRKFRKRWLEGCTIKSVVNFTHVRHIFFNEAVAPFAFVHYQSKPTDPMHRIYYWSAKKSERVDNTKTIVLNLYDLRQVRQQELVEKDHLWKVYWWGNHRDAELIKALSIEQKIKDIGNKRSWKIGQGYTPGSLNKSDWLCDYKEFPIQYFERYGAIDKSNLVEVPKLVHRRGIPDVYDGWRLLVKRGISQADGANGRIESRLEDKPFCVRNSIHGIRMDKAEDWERKVLLGILWSSLARYYFFMTASSWGTWHHEIHLEEIINLPVRLPNDLKLRKRIVQIVEELSGWNPAIRTILNLNGKTKSEIKERRRKLERDLDGAIFDLFELIEPERDLILDMCEVGFEFFYNDSKSEAVKNIETHPKLTQGLASELPEKRNSQPGIEGYLYSFLQIWNRELEPDGEFFWRVIRPANIPMIAVVFTTKEKNKPIPKLFASDQEEWASILKQCNETLNQPVSKRIYIDGIVRAVSDTNIIIIKRDERRLWTRSLAREDAEATLLQAMYLKETSLRSKE